MTSIVSPSREVDVATRPLNAAVSETFAVRVYRTVVAVGSGKPIFPTMTGSIGAIATFGPFAGTGGSLTVTVATKLLTANGDIAGPDLYIASLAAFSGLCAALMRRHRNRCGNAAQGYHPPSIPASATPIVRQAPDRARAVREISRTATGLDDTSRISRRWS
ncbi:hypothetical protein ACWAT4_30755 [Bradyrhizobium manausense]